MVVVKQSLREDYWENFEVQEAEDFEFLYNTLLEKETPLTSQELTTALVEERIRREILDLERQRSAKGEIYLPKEYYTIDQRLVFPALGWKQGQVKEIRPGKNPELGDFNVMRVELEDGELREFASNLVDHTLNNPISIKEADQSYDINAVMREYSEELVSQIEDALHTNSDFVRIAGRWFPRGLLVDVNAGHLNLAEAILDMSGGGPMPTLKLLEQVGLSTEVNQKLVEFSLDLALQEDPRFDEVGPAGQVLWYLQRMEPEGVRQTPPYLQYYEIAYNRSSLTPDMEDLERELDDELSPLEGRTQQLTEVEVKLIFPHWRSGTLPMSARMRHLFPTAYEAPRVLFTLVDGSSGERFPGWVVRNRRYVFGFLEWYASRGLIPGSQVTVRKGKRPGEVVVTADSKRPSREWVRTLLVGSDGGIVFAMLKQIISGEFDERMAIVVPDPEAVDEVWRRMQKERVPFERIVVNSVRELAKLNPQSHVHASELYAAVNIVRRCPPGPILALLADRPWFVHVGDLHFRFDDSEFTQD